MKMKLAVLALMLALLGAVGVVPATATHAAQTPAAAPAAGGLTFPITGTYTNQLGNAATYDLTGTITHFSVVNGVLTATGTYTGTVTDTVTGVVSQVSGVFAAPVQATSTCTILDLTVGPIHLDLLGVMVDTNTIHLTITAQQGPGNLLGNLLCAVAHLLDQNNLNGVANVLNQILGLL